jgi:hypothetical protein
MANAWMWAGVTGIAASVVVGTAWVILLWKALGLLRSLAGLEDRVARLTEALALLADTTETGFRSMTEQLVPVTIAAAPSARKTEQPTRTTTSRVVRASKQGQTATEIAAAEQVSEGEVRLRLNLAQAAARSAMAAALPTRKTQKRKADNGTLRSA